MQKDTTKNFSQETVEDLISVFMEWLLNERFLITVNQILLQFDLMFGNNVFKMWTAAHLYHQGCLHLKMQTLPSSHTDGSSWDWGTGDTATTSTTDSNSTSGRLTPTHFYMEGGL